MTRLLVIASLFLALSAGALAPAPVSAQTCTANPSACRDGDVCCALPPNGSEKRCMQASECAAVNPSFRALYDADNDGARAPGGVLTNPLEADSLTELLWIFLRGIVRLAAIALLVFLVYVGFSFVAAQGNEEKLRTARSALIWTIVGGAILLGAEAIMGIIEATAESLAI